MKNFYKNNNKAFTLMEIGLSLLIISILVIVCIPIVVNQSKKTDEYAYYLAYRTVEKMGSQIVAFGDPEDNTTPNTTSYNTFTDSFKKYVASYSDKIFKIISPSANAAIQTSQILSFPSYEYDFAKLCIGNRNVTRDYEGYAGQSYNESVFDAEVLAIQASSLCADFKKNNYDFIKKRFMCPNMDSSAVLEMLTTTTNNSRQFCKWLAQNCSNADDCSTDNCYFEYFLNDSSTKKYGECMIKIADPEADYVNPTLGTVTDTTISEAVSCAKLGFINMDNGSLNTGNFYCTCDSTHPVKALNNSSACCAQSEDDNKFPYYNDSGACIYCLRDAYNEKSKACCPANSIYSRALQRCVCSEGYTPDNADSLTACVVSNSSCRAGSHLENNTCVSNAPIIKGKRFCELVSYNWNIANSNCNTFTTENGITYNKTLYNAITANNTPYLSAKAVKGAFNSVTPNIILANGLRLWILGDKSASIAGLSFNPDNYSTDVNICKIESGAQSDCTGGTKFYCKNDDKCFSINKGEAAEGESDVPRLSDARNCCSTADFSDLIPLFAGEDYLRDPRSYAISGFTVFVDINGTKDNDDLGGGGTLWKDVFPFYVASSGKVYPGYPLNAAKADDSNKDSSALYQGGNSSALSADVFYYDMVSGKRRKINVYPSIPYARALCFSMDLSAYTPYCQNLGTKYRQINAESRIDKFIRSENNPCFQHRCFFKVKSKVKFL